MQDGIGLGIVSYRPSLVSPLVMAKLDHLLLTRLSLPEELQTLAGYLERDEVTKALLSQLPRMPSGQEYLCSSAYRPLSADLRLPVRFHAGSRKIPHLRQLHKYLRAPLPAHKRFYFHDADGRYLGCSAANLWEFRDRLVDLPVSSLQRHLQRGDFERWLREVLRDSELVRRVQKLGSWGLAGEDLRQVVLEVVASRYEELDSLI